MNLGPWEIGLVILVVLLLFGYKKLPDAARSFGRSLRIFKGEMKGLKDDDGRAAAPATSTAARGELVIRPTTTSGDLSAQALLDEAQRAEAHAAGLRARLDQLRIAESPR
jgi:sec-independent protein translocase protein TatA